MLSGDALTDFDLSSAIATHRKQGALATLVVTEVADPTPYGIVDAGPDGKINAFWKNPIPVRCLARPSTPGYTHGADALALCPDETPFDFSRNLFPRMLEKGMGLFSFQGRGYWSDIGDCRQYIFPGRRAPSKGAPGGVSLPTRPGVWTTSRLRSIPWHTSCARHDRAGRGGGSESQGRSVHGARTPMPRRKRSGRGGLCDLGRQPDRQ